MKFSHDTVLWYSLRSAGGGGSRFFWNVVTHLTRNTLPDDHNSKYMLKFFYQQMHFYLTYKILIIKIYIKTLFLRSLLHVSVSADQDSWFYLYI